MVRFAYDQLIKWKSRGSGRVLIVSGVPGVGKSHLIEEFCNREFNKFRIIDNPSLYDLSDLAIEDTLEDIIIFRTKTRDINLLKGIINIKKLFSNKFIVIEDSFIRCFKEGTIEADYLILRPLSFEEFLFNTNRKLFDSIRELSNIYYIRENFNTELNQSLADYLFVGGMPKAVRSYMSEESDSEIRDIQKKIYIDIFTSLSDVFSNTYIKNIKKIFDLVFPTLIRDNRKFKLSDISSSRRFSALKRYFELIESSNLVYKSNIVHDTLDTRDEKSFILYLFDCGILGAIGDVPRSLYDNKNLLINPITSGIVNNYISTEIRSYGVKDTLFWSHNLSKIEFLLSIGGDLYPIEVKSNCSGKLKSFESFKNFIECNNYYSFNMDLKDRSGVVTLPLYSIGLFVKSLVIPNKVI